MKKLLKIAISICMVFLLMGTGVASPELPQGYQVLRIQGEDRYQTAINSLQRWIQPEFAVIASGENFADALFGGPLAAQANAPLLLTKKNSLPNGLIQSLKQYRVNGIYLLGGENSITKSVENELKDAGFSVIRVAGADRKETAVYISTLTARLRGVEFLGDKFNFIVSGTSFADALSAGPYVHYYRQQFGSNYFLPPTGLSGDMPIGGTASVPPIEKEKRIAGVDRYQTAVEIAKSYKTVLNKEIQTIVLVDGTQYPDSLTATAVATKERAAILLTQPDKLNEDTAKFIEESAVKSVIILGGVNSVSVNVENEVREILKKAGVAQ